MNHVVRLAASGLVGAATTRTARQLFDRFAGSSPWWHRQNHADLPVSLLEGPAIVMGAVAGAVSTTTDVRGALSVATAIGGAGASGIIDDLFEGGEDRARGLRGHLSALRAGRVTTGAVKIVGIGCSAGIAALLLPRQPVPLPRRAVDVVIDTGLIAGTANLVNLFDLRPGRALKVSALLAGLLTGSAASGTAGAVLGTAAAAAPGDLSAQDMAGDAGANALGAAIGHGIAAAAPLRVRTAVLAGVVGLTLLSERVSFSGVIERSPWLRAADEWGRPGTAEVPRDR